MSKILVIEHASSNIAIKLKCLSLEYNMQSDDFEIHRWLISNKEILSTASKLIIPVRLGFEDAEYMGLYIGLHIRLTKELDNVRFLPILFITDESKEDILSNQIKKGKEKSGLLLFTKASYLVSALDLNEFILKKFASIEIENYDVDFLNHLSITIPENSGHHSVANEWGAFRLAKFAGYTLNLEKPSSLYFKFKDSFTNNEIVPNANNIIGHFNESCKALLIDDNADTGWGEVLVHILKNKVVMPGKVSSLDQIRTFEDAMNFTDYFKYDLVFLDLRMIKEEDNINYICNIEEFTGTKILRKIKNVNTGIQVIMFTASNKVWNIEKLLEMGANGYYIKESPEYVQNDVFSKENYNELLVTIKKALSLKYLKQVDAIHRKCLNFISMNRPIRTNSYQRFYDRSIASFDIAYQLLVKTTLAPKYFNLAFLIYFQIIEDFVGQRENFLRKTNRECYVGSHRIRVIDDTTGKLIWKLTFKQDPNNIKYFEIFDETKTHEESIQTLAKVSFVLAFVFNKNNVYLKKWANLNNIRNTKAAHGGANGYVTSANIEELLEIIELIFS